MVADWSTRLGVTEFKGAGNPVTEADREAERAILDLITTQRPDDAVVGEEGSSRPGTSGRRWLIDPLDGTVNFVHGFPHVSVSIAVEDDAGGIAAVVRDVHRSEEFAAMRGQGATLDGRPITVSSCADVADALVATGFGYDRRERGPEYGRRVGAMLTRVQGIRRGGSAALDLAWVACGRLDGYWETTLGPWDIAAGLLLVTEAGGVTSGIDLDRPTPDGVVASGPGIHGALRDAVVTVMAGASGPGVAG